MPSVLLLLLFSAASVLGKTSLVASPPTLADGQGVVIYVKSDDLPQHHLDNVVATCKNGEGTSVLQRVPFTTAVVAARCDEGDAAQRWSVDRATGRIVTDSGSSEDGGRRCLDAGCFETESSGLFSGDVSLCPDDRRDLHGVQWCHEPLDASGEGFTSNEHFAQKWEFTDDGYLRTSYDGQCLSRNAPSYGTGHNGTNGALNLFRCDRGSPTMKWRFDPLTKQIISRDDDAKGDRGGSGDWCLALDDEGMAQELPAGYTAAVRFGTLPPLRCDWHFTLLSIHGRRESEEIHEEIHQATGGSAVGSGGGDSVQEEKKGEEKEEAWAHRTGGLMAGRAFRGGAFGVDFGAVEAVASVVVPSRSGADSPRFVRLSAGDAPGEQWVSWTSNSNSGVPLVQFAVGAEVYGVSSNGALRAGSFGRSVAEGAEDPLRGALPREATGYSVTYTASDMCEAPANRTGPFAFTFPGYQHHVKLSGLLNATDSLGGTGGVMAYRVGLSDGSGGWSAVREVRILPPPGAKEPVTFLGFGDMGVDAAQQGSSTILWGLRDVVEHRASFALHFGDLGYACGVGLVWDAWHAMIEPLSARVPYLVSMGNHEYVWEKSYYPGHDSQGECGVPVERRFQGPSNGRGMLWYSFSSGAVHVVMLSTEHDLAPGSEQYEWLQADLKAAAQPEARAAVPWIVVTAHRMLYTTQLCEDDDFDRAAGLRESLDPLLDRFRVNLVLVGHQHSYERTCAIINGTCATSGWGASSSSTTTISSSEEDGVGGVAGDGVGTVHAVVGSAGAELEKCGFSRLNGLFDVAHANMWGYARMTADHESFTFQFVANNDGSIFDEVQLTPWH